MIYTPIPELVISLAFPTIASMLVSNIYNLVDTAFVSSLGNSASGAVGVVFGYMAILQAVGFLFGQGAGSNIASELGTMRVTQQIDALDIMGVNSANYLILPKILGLVTLMPFLVIFANVMGIVGAYATAYVGHILTPEDLTLGLQHDFNAWFVWMSIIKSIVFAFIIASVSSFCGYTVEGGSVEVGKASTSAVVSSSVLILFTDVFLTQLLS